MYPGARRLLTLCILAPLFTLATFFAVRYFTAARLYPGDRMEVRACRVCGGDGVDEEMARDVPELGNVCRFCGGDGKVDVLLPGPNHPTTICGVVADASRVSPLDTYRSFKPRPSSEAPIAFESPPGILAGVRLTFKRNEEVIEATESGDSGLFTVELPPGRYVVQAELDGYQMMRDTIDIPILTEPIWMEQAKMVREPESPAEARSLYGLELLIVLAKPGGGNGAARLTADYF